MLPLFLFLLTALAREPAGTLAPDTFRRPPPLRPTATLETPNADQADRLGAGVTVHVLLQVHPRYSGGESVDTPESRRCREQAVSTILASGVKAVVVEGFVLEGPLDDPVPLAPTTAPTSIGGALAAAPTSIGGGMAVYGFERADVHRRSTASMEAMRDAADGMTALKTSSDSEERKLARLDELQRDFFAANTEFVTAAMPLRSFQALETALAVAAHHDADEVFLVIGRSHWPDFPHALQTADRLGNDRFVGLRIVRYECT